MLHLMEQCRDFSEEDTSLNYIARKLGATVDRDSKCHSELAGERIKYPWGRARSLYCMLKLKDKRGKANVLKMCTPLHII